MLLIILILCSQDVWLPILDTVIEYPGIARLPIIMYNVIKPHVNHHVGPVVDTSCSYDRIFVHLRRASRTSHYTDLTYDHVGHACSTSNFFQKSRWQEFWFHSAINQYQDLGEWLCIQIMPQIWFSIFDGRTFPYVWCLEWTCPGPECLILNPKLVNSLTQFLLWLVTVHFIDN